MGNERTYTVGVAGHIDHGKTTLVKAMTNMETDRLKEEKERNISIEPGFAKLDVAEGMHVSLIDVPGHERFIRQMIAGVAGIDMVMLVIAADEGVMPQTREHMDILHLLGIEHALIVISKIDLVEEELLEIVQLDVEEAISGTGFQDAPVVLADSVSKTGIEDIKASIQSVLAHVPPRDVRGAFRLPIDQVFTVHGQGTVVRGTVYEGSIQEGETLTLLPSKERVRGRSLQVHHQAVETAQAGQRLAINVGGIDKEKLKRGDVLVAAEHYTTTKVIDIALTTVDALTHPLKQRGYIKLHLGTAEVYGKIVFFDRNQLTEQGAEVLCQLRLDEEVVTKRGDRFILRRPTPVETIGGGVIIEPSAGKYRFGQETVDYLAKLKEGTTADRLLHELKVDKVLSFHDWVKQASVTKEVGEEEIDQLVEQGDVYKLPSGTFTLRETYQLFKERVEELLHSYHEKSPLRQGMNKNELLQELTPAYPRKLSEIYVDWAEEEALLKKKGPLVSLASFEPYYPRGYGKRMERVTNALRDAGRQVPPFIEMMEKESIPEELQPEFRHYLVETNQAVLLDEKHLLSIEAFTESVERLKAQTGTAFTLQEAKDILGLTRKLLVPLLETLDEKGLTRREDNQRVWR
ncbi:selenocysteine-specific translation elongation factor [Salsuginibacillus kocurii]|uniref:selenocysteine-specific translation elongation factor n=1 Tax=Salsuginibacillus kocurii TaxID=427078 RepID=UPI0003763D76|nr:selenocysteine-specific translation elongation factor [Salsuginibacillus kocurii]